MVDDIIAFVQSELASRANPEKAVPMAAYMKTDMPFYGVQKPGRVPVYRGLREFPLETREEYEAAVLALWNLPHREEKYVALNLAEARPRYITFESMDLYERLIREGAWWDLVDGVATHLVGTVLLDDRARVRPVMDRWIDDDDMWIRRAAIISHNRHKGATDHPRLFRYCLRRADETEFFIRKAIGWALRDYSYAAPDRVREFLLANKDRLSGLSFREGAKRLRREGLME